MTAHRVLVVEDDLEIRESLIEILEDQGYEAVGAGNGLEALDRLRDGPQPCLIFLDLMMPRMDGRAFRQEQLRSPELASIPVVVISAFRDVNHIAQELQAADLLKKPFKLQELVSVMRRHCPAGAQPC
jgi:CheY-like chemotaxis protein